MNLLLGVRKTKALKNKEEREEKKLLVFIPTIVLKKVFFNFNDDRQYL